MDPNDPPPGYDELLPVLPPGVKPRSKSPFDDAKSRRSRSPFIELEMLDPLVGPPEPAASAPFLTGRGFQGIPSLNQVMEEIPNLINIKDGPHSESLDQEEFLIRDSVESLVAKGVVRKPAGTRCGFQYINVQSVDGQIFLHVGFSGGKIVVQHRNTFIGGINMMPETPNTVKLTRSYENQTYTLNHLSPNDIVICRDGTQGHICKLHIPGVTRFDSSILYSDRNQVTAIEKCLCLSVALVYMAARNDIRTVIANDAQNRATGLLCLFCVGAVVGIIILIIVIVNAPKKKYGKYG